jgi:replicative DNA helicase
MSSEFDRMPPHDISAEQCTLGGMLLSVNAIADVVDIIGPGDHYRPAHQVVHEAIMELYGRGEPADAVTISDVLGKRGELARIGGAPYLHTLIASVPTAANAAYYARIVAEQAQLRRLVEVGTRIAQFGYSGDGAASELTERAQAEAHSLTTGQDAGTGKWMSEAVYEAADGMDENLPDDRVTFPFADLRALIPMLRPGQLITVAARPGHGKTVLLGDVVRAAARRGLPVAWFTLEMTRNEVITRCLSAEARVNFQAIQEHSLDEHEWKRIGAAVNTLADFPVFIDEKGASTAAHMRSQVRKMSRVMAPRLIVVDYLQLMRHPGTRSRQEEVSELARGLKEIAKEEGVPVLAAAQLNRGPEGRQDKMPVMSDLRESGEIENSSDMVILLHREDEYDRESPRAGEADLIVAKHRGGPKATITVAFQGRFCRFVDMAPDELSQGEQQHSRAMRGAA